MLNKKTFTKAALGITLATIICAQPLTAFAATSDNANKINNGIAGLNYNKYEVLANQGDVIESVVPKEGIMENGKFIVIERSKKSMTTTPIDISVVESIVDRTYPGALILADSSFADNRPTALVADRAPMNITIDLPGLGSGNTTLVNKPTYANVTSAVDEMIDKWAEENSDTHTLPSRTQYSETMVYSKYQLSMGLNIDIQATEPLFGINFEAAASGEEKYMVAAYKQIFYSVSAELPNNPSDLFGPDVTFKELQRKGVSDTAPPLMVNNTAYGRTVYVIFKTSSHSEKVEQAFKALIKGQKIEEHSEMENVVNNSTFTAVVLGGDAYEHNKIITTDFDQIRNVIKENSAFSTKNPGYPISYTSSFVKDNALAAVHNSTDYVETKSTAYSKGKINLDHSGAYVAKFHISWDEVSYDENGKEILTHKEWKDNGKNLTAHYSSSINLPANARNIQVKAEECTGLAWEWWRTVVDEVSMPLSGNINISIWGTTLHPRTSVTFE